MRGKNMNNDYLSELKELKTLQAEGIITEEEFNKKKELLLFGKSEKSINKNSSKINNNVRNNKKIFTNKSLIIIDLVIAVLFITTIFMLCFSKVDIDYFYINHQSIYAIGSPFIAGDVRKIFSIIEVILLPLSTVIIIISLFFQHKLLQFGKHTILLITLIFGFLTFIFNLTYGAGSGINLCTLFGLIFIGIATLLEFWILLTNIYKFFKQ